jgi:hypothetical protein
MKKRPNNCECDNTHEQNKTCCQPCWNAGFRTVAPSEPKEKLPTFIELAEWRLSLMTPREKTCNIKISRGTCRMMVEAEKEHLKNLQSIVILAGSFEWSEWSADGQWHCPKCGRLPEQGHISNCPFQLLKIVKGV